MARAVLLVGIPYPQIKDPKIILKKRWNDRKFRDWNQQHMKNPGDTSPKFVNGSDWYRLQAFRGLFHACVCLSSYCRAENNFDGRFVLDLSSWRISLRQARVLLMSNSSLEVFHLQLLIGVFTSSRANRNWVGTLGWTSRSRSAKKVIEPQSDL